VAVKPQTMGAALPALTAVISAETLVVSIAAYLIPGKKLGVEEIVTIGIVAAATFSVLDLFAPSISSSVRTGAGLGIGVNLVGGFNAPGPMVA
jgi:hypothetical protein